MSEFLSNYGFFILIALFMVLCHLGHGSHGGHGRRRDDERGKGGLLTRRTPTLTDAANGRNPCIH